MAARKKAPKRAPKRPRKAPSAPPKKRGPKPQLTHIPMSLEDAVATAMRKEKPPEGWPEPKSSK